VASAVPTPVALAPGEVFDVAVSFDPGRRRVEVVNEVVVTHDAAYPAGPLTVALRGEATLTAVTDAPGPVALALAAWPNPFNPAVMLAYDLPRAAAVTLCIHDLSGRVVRTLVAGEAQPAGSQLRRWDGRDDAGRPLPSGSYLVRVAAGGTAEARRVVLLK
jgi:hypothetical protein